MVCVDCYVKEAALFAQILWRACLIGGQGGGRAPQLLAERV